MSDDVLITPASRKIEFKDSSGNVDGKIELDSAGNLVLTSPGGGIEIGDSSSDIFVGNGTANIDIICEQNGEIRGTTGRTVTLGQSDSNITVDALNFNTSTSTLFKSQNGITSTRLSTTTNGTGASTENSTFTAPHTLVGVNNGSTQYALLATLPATTSSTLDHVTIEGELGSWTDSTSFRVKFNIRSGFEYDYTLFDHNPVFNASGIVAYQASNGTVTVHAKLTASTYGKLTYKITDAFEATVVDKPSLTTSTPAGTLIFDTNDTSTYTPRFRFPDNQKLEFGAAADLRIYHDGSNSIIEDNGTGSLQLKGAVNINGAYTLPAADGNNAQVLATNGSGTISFQSVGSLAGSGIQNVSDDTSPQLGGNLASAANNIQFGDSSGSTDDRLQFGASQDLQIYHNGTDSFIDNTTGALKIATATSGIAVTIGHTTSETTIADNLTVTGNLTVNGGQILSEDGYVGFGDSSADNWGKIEYLSSDPTGFTSQYTNAVAVDNEQGTTNQQIYIFDTAAGNDADLFGIAAGGAAILSVTGQGDIKFLRPNANTSYDITLATPTPTASRTVTLPDATGTISLITATETLTNKTLTAPTVTGGMALSNSDITGVNSLYFNDPGSGEGLRWNGGNMKLFEAPDNLSNAAGNLQITYSDARRFTVSNSGAEVIGTLTTSGGITFSDGTTQTSAGASTGFSIAMATALG